MSLTGPEQSSMNYKRVGKVLIAGNVSQDVCVCVDADGEMIGRQRGKESRLNVQLFLCRWISRFVVILCVGVSS